MAIVTQGPGNLGTGTRWGFSGVVGRRGGQRRRRPRRAARSAALRVSEGDLRERHLGVSHHCLTAYGRVALARPQVRRAGAARRASASGSRSRPSRWPRGTSSSRCRSTGWTRRCAGSPVRLSTMGRGLDEDLAYFLASAAAGATRPRCCS